MANSTIDVRVKKLRPSSQLPSSTMEGNAGYDLYADIPCDVIIQPHETIKIGTGVAIEPPAGCFGAIFARSGIASKRGLRPANCTAVCDPNYTGEYIVALHNDSLECQTVQPGERIAQVVFLPFVYANFIEVNELENTERGDSGFGSSGEK